MAAGPWMVIGVPVTSTSSFDTFVNSTVPGQGYIKGQDCAFIGIPGAAAPPSTSFWTSGSDEGGITPNDDAMFTPYPSSSEGGKLYFITCEVYNDPNLTVPEAEFWADLQDNAVAAPGYLVVTPFNSPDKGYFIYSFEDIDDLITNGWRISDGAGNPIDKADWTNTVTATTWVTLTSGQLDASGTTKEKEQIVACTLAYTPVAANIQSQQSVSPLIKGAILVTAGGAGGGDWTDTGYIVPFADIDVIL